jgi:hypothetical protein
MSGDQLWDIISKTVKSIDFTDLPKIIDCNLKASTITTTNVSVAVNTDFRQGQRITGVNEPGNVNGLLVTDFLVTNVTDGLVITPSGVVELDGVYTFTYAAQTSNDKMEISIKVDTAEVVNYSGKVTFLIP